MLRCSNKIYLLKITKDNTAAMASINNIYNIFDILKKVDIVGQYRYRITKNTTSAAVLEH